MWQKAWFAAAPLLSTEGLEALAKALRNDDTRLLQGATCTPPPLSCVQDWPVEAACLLGFCAWKGDEGFTVAQTEEFFAKTCFTIDQAMNEPAGCRWLLNWYDETPRDEMRRLLLPEVEMELARREDVFPHAVVMAK